MKSYCAILLLLSAAALTGCINISDWHTVQGSGRSLAETREVSQFDRVSVSGAGELTIEQGDQESLTIEADDNLLPFIRSDVNGRHLSICARDVNLHPTQTIRYQLRLRDLTELHLSGSVRAQAGTLRTKRLVLAISGSGNIAITDLDSPALSVQISGSGRTSAAGRAERQEINISGSGEHHAPELKCAQAEVQISGSGHATLWVVEVLSAHISGSGRVDYRGRPSVESHVSGSGRVHHLSGAD
jgi:hypothetical protein